MLSPNVSNFLGCDADYASARTVIFGAAFDSTSSYRPGSRFAPAAIRSESYGIETYSPYQDRDLADAAVFDSGDPELCIGDASKALSAISERAAAILSDGKRPLMFGGEHLVTLGALREAVRRYPGLNVVHFDAHADLRSDYLGAPLSHATVLRRVWELVGDGRIWQFGIRSGTREEFAFACDHTHMFPFELRPSDLSYAVQRIGGAPVYLTVDLDVLDPSDFPGTGTPEAGGVDFRGLLGAILCVSGLNIVAADMVELSPPLDAGGASTALACKLARELMIALSKKE